MQPSKYISLDRALPVKAACQNCRSRHQKCDGIAPSCIRCRRERRTCNYAPSRRGRSVAQLHDKQGERAIATSPPAIKMQLECSDDPNMGNTLPAASSNKGFDILDLDGWHDAPLIACPTYLGNEPMKSMLMDPILTSSFYSSFWPSHPFLPPHNAIGSHLRRSKGSGLALIIHHLGGSRLGNFSSC